MRELIVKGNCNWFTVGAAVALFLATCASFCGAFGRFASGRAAGEKVSFGEDVGRREGKIADGLQY